MGVGEPAPAVRRVSRAPAPSHPVPSSRRSQCGMPISSGEPSVPIPLKWSPVLSPNRFSRKPICKPSSRFWPLGCSAGEPERAVLRMISGERQRISNHQWEKDLLSGATRAFMSNKRVQHVHEGVARESVRKGIAREQQRIAGSAFRPAAAGDPQDDADGPAAASGGAISMARSRPATRDSSSSNA